MAVDVFEIWYGAEDETEWLEKSDDRVVAIPSAVESVVAEYVLDEDGNMTVVPPLMIVWVITTVLVVFWRLTDMIEVDDWTVPEVNEGVPGPEMVALYVGATAPRHEQADEIADGESLQFET